MKNQLICGCLVAAGAAFGAFERPTGVLRGFDKDHRVERVTFEAIRLNGADVTDTFRRKVSRNAFADVK